MGMFPEDARIPVSKLISLWIAEGFVKNIGSRRLIEEEAEGDSVDVITECPNLQELNISLASNGDSSEICLKLESLTQLQILRLGFRWCIIQLGLHLPSNLKKLVLLDIPIESAISSIAGLLCLEYLQLRYQFLPQSGEWCLGDITFHQLKVLKLVNLGISRLHASEESFPLLETLVIKSARAFEEVPLSFAYITTLKQIKLTGYLKESLEASAVRITEEAESIEGWDRLKLITVE
ncbi:hypothetical protein HAX54_048115 [Datura stramonium]|uniref:Disease resistance protein winged helix domain-containing protein n=1 Tax=Datura stramonium TaxID=4076 RepID=A0ABS8STS8_DATST|nr:hypothetical protein [Datura stramonium]